MLYAVSNLDTYPEMVLSNEKMYADVQYADIF